MKGQLFLHRTSIREFVLLCKAIEKTENKSELSTFTLALYPDSLRSPVYIYRNAACAASSTPAQSARHRRICERFVGLKVRVVCPTRIGRTLKAWCKFPPVPLSSRWPAPAGTRMLGRDSRRAEMGAAGATVAGACACTCDCGCVGGNCGAGGRVTLSSRSFVTRGATRSMISPSWNIISMAPSRGYFRRTRALSHPKLVCTRTISPTCT